MPNTLPDAQQALKIYLLPEKTNVTYASLKKKTTHLKNNISNGYDSNKCPGSLWHVIKKQNSSYDQEFVKLSSMSVNFILQYKCSLSCPSFQFNLFFEYAQVLLSEVAMQIYFWGLSYKNSIKYFVLEKTRKTSYIQQIGHWIQPPFFKCQIISTA